MISSNRACAQVKRAGHRQKLLWRAVFSKFCFQCNGSLLAGVNDVLRACGHSESADINMLQLLLYGNKNLPLEANKMILNLTIKYISETELVFR